MAHAILDPDENTELEALEYDVGTESLRGSTTAGLGVLLD
jgi:hypothetical protein